jgi:glycosyltransferase involved in cell wall biosynthesis
VVVPNGIPDPCPEFEATVFPERKKRIEVRTTQASPICYYDVLFVAGRMTPKGLFDAIKAVRQANAHMDRGGSSLRFRLTVAGPFENEAERDCFDADARDLNKSFVHPGEAALCVYAGWADETKKRELYRAADCLIFPTTYPSESFGLVLAEAMAHGCAVITTRWQAVPEVLPPGDPNVVEPHDIDAMAAALLRCAAAPADRSMREYFLTHFTRERFVRDMVRVLGEV